MYMRLQYSIPLQQDRELTTIEYCVFSISSGLLLNGTRLHNRLMLWYSNWNCFNNLFLMWPINRSCSQYLSVLIFELWLFNSLWCGLLLEIVRTIGWCSEFPFEIVSTICFWSCLLIGMFWANGFCPGLPTVIFSTICFVSCLLLELLHTK